jgi:hypothetical protein
MSRLSDFQQQSVVVDEKVMTANAKAAGSQTDWRSTKIKTSVRGGRIDAEPFEAAARQTARNIAFDAEQDMRTARRIAAHLALEEALDEAADDEPEEEDEDAEPAEETTQRSHGGGCGKSFTCDSGQLITGRKSTDEIRRLGLNYAVF